MPNGDNTNLHFLVVDDSTSMRRIIKRVIADMGFEDIHEASNAQNAWDLLQECTVDFIVCDWNMPGMKGIDFLSRVRENERFRDMPFLMVSAESQTSNIFEAIQGGVSNYLTKPFTPDMLQQKIQAIINQCC